MSFSLTSLENEEPGMAAMLALLGPEVHRGLVVVCQSQRTAGSAMSEKSKMAAELSTLVSSYLDQDPERYGALLLECLNSRQLLRYQVRESVFLYLAPLLSWVILGTYLVEGSLRPLCAWRQ